MAEASTCLEAVMLEKRTKRESKVLGYVDLLHLVVENARHFDRIIVREDQIAGSVKAQADSQPLDQIACFGTYSLTPSG